MRTPGNTNLPIGVAKVANREISVPGPQPALAIVFLRGTNSRMRGLASPAHMVR
jgi:hypothetical protein